MSTIAQVPSPPVSFNKAEPDPKPNEQPAVWDLVIDDMRARDAFGRDHYGTPLQAFNGRNPEVDAYQEVLDLAAYFRQAIIERETMRAELASVADDRDRLVARLKLCADADTEVRRVCKAGGGEETVIAVRRALRDRDDEIKDLISKAKRERKAR